MPRTLEHDVDDAELIVEHPADHDGGDDRRHHQRQQDEGLHQPAPGEPRFSSSAIASPRTSEQRTLANMKPNVLGSTMPRNSSSRST